MPGRLILRSKVPLVWQLLRECWAARLNLKPAVSQPADPSILVNSLYKVALGRRAEPDGLANRVRQLESGLGAEALAEELVSSAEFRMRHGSSSTVDMEYVAALYRDGLGRSPDPEGFAHWLAEGEKGATRAKVLAEFAKSAESLEKALALTDPTRNELLLLPVSRAAQIIEIGPSYSPIAPKAEGWNTRTVDHTTREGLIAKYIGQPGVDVSRIEEVDFVWTRGLLSEAVPATLHGTFDALIASHLIEHTPDLIAFLSAASTLLKPDGVVVLAIPDKRYCFDYFQPLTTTGQVLEAHAEGRSRHTRRLAFDHVAYAVKAGEVGAWGQHPTRGLRFFHTIEEARDMFASFGASEEYVDLHAWRFVPANFELLLLELARLGETDWRIERINPASGCEFFAWLGRGGAAVAASLTPQELAAQRLGLLKRALIETQVQIDWLLAGEPDLVPLPSRRAQAEFRRSGLTHRENRSVRG
jgi:SAM-dependent methyltransferase